MPEYYELSLQRVSESEAVFFKTASLVAAAKQASDCEFVELLVNRERDVNVEYVICDLTSDGIPSRNQVGILYKERIAFVIASDIGVPRTLALRKDFPLTMHQNSVLGGTPKELCLYEESDEVIEINWTPERHLRRTLWWLTQTSQSQLHGISQPVEQAFFVPAATIVLPSDLLTGLRAGLTLEAQSIEQSNSSSTKFFLIAGWVRSDQQVGGQFNILDLLTSPITHGVVLSPPGHFSELIVLLASWGIDIVEQIRTKLKASISNHLIDPKTPSTLVLLNIPIRRTDIHSAERVQTIGFWVRKSILALAQEFEVVVTANNLPNVDLHGQLHSMRKQLPDNTLMPVEILYTPDSETRRRYSGYADSCDKGVLIGAGALGATLLDIWVRGGWGTWTVVDDDVFRPHNFVRHIETPRAVGFNKAKVVAETSNTNFMEKLVTPVAGDACKLLQTELKQCFSNAQLVVDASASLSYSRDVSLLQHAPRHVSVFFSPSGNGAVLLLEDFKRKARLASLEAQYYRALISHDIGKTHLTDGVSKFRSGATCRDVSVVMSHSRVLSLSSLLADQIRLLRTNSEGRIRIWQDDPNTGERILTDVPVYRSKANSKHTGNQFDVFWDEGIEASVRLMRTEALPNETGGILVGYHDMARCRVYIVEALPAPIDSVSTPHSFQRGVAGVVEKVTDIIERTSGNVSYIGEWHSHPNGAPATMSKLDRLQLAELAQGLAGDGLPAYQMIVSDKDVNVFEEYSGPKRQ